jgi:hypothetical protein
MLFALSAGVASAALGMAYVFGWPGLLGKTKSGRLLGSSYLLFWPYHLMNYGSLIVFRMLRVVPFQEVVPGLYLGGRLLPWDRVRLSLLAPLAVLDLTCEFCEVKFLRSGAAYLCLPLLDGTAPSQPALAAGVKFITEQLRRGPVYVHCAMGHGRGATFVGGYLLASRKAANVAEAVKHLKSKRPGVRLRAEQLQALKEFSE